MINTDTIDIQPMLSLLTSITLSSSVYKFKNYGEQYMVNFVLSLILAPPWPLYWPKPACPLSTASCHCLQIMLIIRRIAGHLHDRQKTTVIPPF